MPYFTYLNKLCYYEEQGKGAPLILLHGNTASSRMFFNTASHFADRYQVILIDFLGHGKSDRVDKLPVDLWYDQALQVIDFLEQQKYCDVNLVGSSGGALVAINVALERPDLVKKIIADSFEGEAPIKEYIENLSVERTEAKLSADGISFFEFMHGADWKHIVDNDTNAILEHAHKIGHFFHKPLNILKADILLTGTKEDEFIKNIQLVYNEVISKIGHGDIYLFEKGGHPALMSNSEGFVNLVRGFLDKQKN